MIIDNLFELKIELSYELVNIVQRPPKQSVKVLLQLFSFRNKSTENCLNDPPEPDSTLGKA